MEMIPNNDMNPFWKHFKANLFTLTTNGFACTFSPAVACDEPELEACLSELQASVEAVSAVAAVAAVAGLSLKSGLTIRPAAPRNRLTGDARGFPEDAAFRLLKKSASAMGELWKGVIKTLGL